jgi:hypothetical protein
MSYGYVYLYDDEGGNDRSVTPAEMPDHDHSYLPYLILIFHSAIPQVTTLSTVAQKRVTHAPE